MSDDFFAELQQTFLLEAQDLLQRVEQLSLQLEKDKSNEEVFAELARLAHNFKGSGKAVGFEHISKLGHKIEDYILAIKNGVLEKSPSNLDFLFQCLDVLKSDIEKLGGNLNISLNHEDLFTEITNRIENPTTSDSAPSEAEVEVLHTALEETPPAITEIIAETSVETTAEMSSAEAPVKVHQEAAAPSSHHPQSSNQKPDSSQSSAQEFLRIQKSKVDYLLESFGEQVILQSTLNQYMLDPAANLDAMIKVTGQLTKLTFELQNHTLSLSMVQMHPLFTKLERAIRDVSRMCEKEVSAVFEGGDTEVDKLLVDALSDPLIHMVRNSVDHGLEQTAERKEKGKDLKGEVKVRALRNGGQIWIEVSDDGKGLNPEFIRNKAVSKGLISQQEANQLSDQQCFQLIFKNGFSTRDVASEVSGRGVGMNVVEETVTKLKGKVEIESQIGKGTKFTLKLPLSLAIFNGALVRVNDARFVIPSSDISEIVKVEADKFLDVNESQRVIDIRGDVFQVIDLRKRFKSGSTSGSSTVQNKTEIPMILCRDGRKVGFVVDEVLGMQKVVQKSLGQEVKRHPEYAAATILGDGSPGLILNMSYLSSEVAA